MARSPFSGPEPWDLVAPTYATQLAPHLAAYAADALAWGEVGEGTRVLDVAAGPGTLALQAAALGAVVEALDVSPEMVRCLTERAQPGLVARGRRPSRSPRT